MTFSPDLMQAVRNRFAHVDNCPEQGPRIFFENAGGSLTLKTVVETSTRYAAIPDNQGRDNPMSKAQVDVIAKARADAMLVLGASSGQVFVGESGTELLFRMIMNACLGTDDGAVLGSSLEHPASRSAARRWAKISGKRYISVPHDSETGSVSAEAYAAHVTPDTRVATILHTSPVTGMSVDVAAVSETIRKVAPDCIIIVDGIQHAAHGALSIDSYNIDGYAISPYKMFSRHGYGLAWISDRLTALPHDALDDGPEGNWELGTRDTGAYATFLDVVEYLEWLGTQVSDVADRRERIEAASKAIHDHEKHLTDVMINGTGNLTGLADLPGIQIIGGADNPRREGLVCISVKHIPAADIVSHLRENGIRAHVRKADHYSGNILTPLGLESAVRISLCHYNDLSEVKAILSVLTELPVDAKSL
ncbi:MAG: aminotransferase class V-fold PLP-dependent enzyme [Pseudomonadota bacterium]